jgi:hypothetical protein
MIANHDQFLAAILDRKKVCVRFYSQPDSGVLDRVCAPMDYGPGEKSDGVNRYWLWDYAGEANSRTIGLIPQQILDVQVLGTLFDPGEFNSDPPGARGGLTQDPTPVPGAPTSDNKAPVL